MSPSITIKIVPPPNSKEIGHGTFRSIIVISPFILSKALQNCSVDYSTKNHTIVQGVGAFYSHSVALDDKEDSVKFLLCSRYPRHPSEFPEDPFPFFQNFDCESDQGKGESGTGVRLIKGSFDSEICGMPRQAIKNHRKASRGEKAD